MTRPETVIPDVLPAQYPISQESSVMSGFGRGSSELGIPTANVDVSPEINALEPGIYFGWSRILPDADSAPTKHKRHDGKEVLFNNGVSLEELDLKVLPMVMSIGWNPFYQNKEKAAEVHIIHKFSDNFYGASIKYTVLGYIRPELNYTTKGTYLSQPRCV